MIGLPFGLPFPAADVARMSPLALAFLGDAVWELYVRRHILSRGAGRPHTLHQATASYVRASTQAWLVRRLADWLTPDEADILRRGRNAKPGHVRRSAGVAEYRHSTGFEALLGYLYGSGQVARLDEICRMALAWLDEREGWPDEAGRSSPQGRG